MVADAGCTAIVAAFVLAGVSLPAFPSVPSVSTFELAEDVAMSGVSETACRWRGRIPPRISDGCGTEFPGEGVSEGAPGRVRSTRAGRGGLPEAATTGRGSDEVAE